MVDSTADFASWLEQADIPQGRLTAEVVALLRAAFRFRQQQGTDYFSTRLLGHFLLHADTGLKVAQIARLLGISRPTASHQQGLSSRQAIQQAHHRLDGRPYGKLLPRFAGPIAGFLHAHPDASRADLLAFIESTFDVSVSRIALYKFLKKYGLDHRAGVGQPQAGADPPPAPASAQPQAPRPAGPAPPILLPGPGLVPVPAPPPFSSGEPSTPAPSC
jgi:hypothetical protein